ncbi:MAG: GAF domain-containing protein [Polyangiaceae bacterium]|nr:ATP-binding protein [Polyangiaceae bacterium]NUQ72377.1 GAF domain-containing protein [Polyangiaceae bacterium]
MSDDRDRRSAVASLGEARAAVDKAAKTPEIRRVLGPVIAEIDRAIATLDPAAGGGFSLTPLANTVPPQSTSELEALRREVERFRALAEHERGLLETVLTQSPHGILVCDKQGKLILQNRASERIWAGSATADDIEGWGKYRAFHPDGRPFEPGDWSMARCLLQGEVIEAEEVHFQRFDGTHGVLLGSCAPIRGREAELLGAVSVFADITRFKQVEEALRVSEAWLSTTLRSIGDAVIATDTESRITFMNLVAEELTGYTIQEAKGQPLKAVFRVLSKQTREEVESPVAKVLREGSVVGTAAHTFLVRKDRSEVIIDDSGAPIRDDRGELVGVVLVFRDMTEKSRTEERRELLVEASGLLASSRVDYEMTLVHLARLAVPRIGACCAIDIVDADGALRRIAIASTKGDGTAVSEDRGRWFAPEPPPPSGVHNVLQTGRPEITAELSEASLLHVIHDPEDIARLAEKGPRSSMIVPMQAALRALGAITFISHPSQRFGSDDLVLAQELASRAAIAVDNALLYREARRAEEEAQKQASRMNTLAELSRSFIEAGIDWTLVLQTVARRVAEVMGDGCVVRLLSDDRKWLEPVAAHHTDPQASDYIKSILASKRVRVGDDAADRTSLTGEASLIERTPVELPNEPITEEHRRFLEQRGMQSVIVAPLRAPGRPVGTLTVFRDRPGDDFSPADRVLAQEIADRAALAIENARLHQETREAARAREDLLAIVSHDLRNPLGVVMMTSELLLRTGGSDKQGEQIRKQAEKIRRAVERMNSLIGNLLDATRIQAGRFPVESKPQDITQLVGESLDMLRELAVPRGIQLTRQFDPGLPPVSVDRERILQVLSNLVGNALKFTPEGGSIRVRVAQADDHVLISVADTGSGIPDEYVPHLFERYWKGKRDGRTGTGLGLYIAKGIVEAHNGRIWLESRLGVGTTFYFTLPLTTDEQRMTPSEAAAL